MPGASPEQHICAACPTQAALLRLSCDHTSGAICAVHTSLPLAFPSAPARTYPPSVYRPAQPSLPVPPARAHPALLNPLSP